MSGKFVSAGSLDQNTDRDKEWLQARQELESKQKERESIKPEHDGKTLFEVLQANKAAKEEAFQESIKLKNQFRALNDDEVDFLDSQAEAARAKEQAVRQETSEQLEVFRQKQDAAGKNALTVQEGEHLEDNDTDWTTSKKRKRAKQKESIKGVKVYRSSSELLPKSDGVQIESETPRLRQEEALSERIGSNLTGAPDSKVSVAKKQGLSLVEYGSDEDSD